MFFLISKLSDLLFVPSNLIGLAAVASVMAIVFRRARTANILLLAVGGLLVIVGWTPIGSLALMTLENRFPRPIIVGPVTGIIMLEGAVDTRITGDRNSPALNDAAERVTATADLGRHFPDARIFLSGGSGYLTANGPLSESQVTKDLLVSEGIPVTRIEREQRSGDTCQNATESLISLKPKEGDHWVLITSASQMPRAVACFRAAGFPVLPYPVDYRTRSDDQTRLSPTVALGLDAADLAAREWKDLIAYRLEGMTKELFPSP